MVEMLQLLIESLLSILFFVLGSSAFLASLLAAPFIIFFLIQLVNLFKLLVSGLWKF